jgi:hypothetical protein
MTLPSHNPPPKSKLPPKSTVCTPWLSGLVITQNPSAAELVGLVVAGTPSTLLSGRLN